MAEVTQSYDMCAALMGGTKAMRAMGKSLLPQWPNEDDGAYKIRLSSATLHPVFRRTVLVNSARPFSKPPTYQCALSDDWLENIDLQNTTITMFANSLLVECLAYGMCGLLVEYPKAEGVRTKADEKAAGVRPYFVKYSQQNILGWKIGEGMRLTQLRLLETVEEDDGDFATQTVEQVRVLEVGAWRIFRKNEAEDWVEYDSGTTTLPVIPFVFFYGQRIAFGNGRSPLIDLAFQNIEHYQSSSDQQTILHVSRVPILVAIGFGDSEITIGASTAVTTDNPDASLEYVEHTGAAIAAGRQSTLDLEDRMRSTGAELISQIQSQTTATQVNAEGEASKSTLQQIVEGFEESLELALSMAGQWVGSTADVEVGLFKSYETALDGDSAVLGSACQTGVISKQTHFTELQRRDVISPELQWEEEQKRIGLEKPSNAGL